MTAVRMKKNGNRSSGTMPERTVRETLKGTNTSVTGFFLSRGANFYVFSYERDGVKKHTFIDGGDPHYRDEIMDILVENDIEPANTERIIITHHHSDHCGVADLLAKESGAKVLVHHRFRDYLEREPPSSERSRWNGTGFEPANLQPHIHYLEEMQSKNIGGIDFPILGDLINVGEGAKLQVFGCPSTKHTHSPDQLFVLYSPRNCPETYERIAKDFRPTDEILFSGDLWLMEGPQRNWNTQDIRSHFCSRLRRIWVGLRGRGKGTQRPSGLSARQEDVEAKEALKTGFGLVRVFPGHPHHRQGFLGSSIVANGLLAERDLLVKMGFSLDANKAILKGRVQDTGKLQEEAYRYFVGELKLWLDEYGYDPEEISQILVRIYDEQTGGGRLVEQDREERRERLKETLARLKDDGSVSAQLCQLAESVLQKLGESAG